MSSRCKRESPPTLTQKKETAIANTLKDAFFWSRFFSMLRFLFFSFVVIFCAKLVDLENVDNAILFDPHKFSYSQLHKSVVQHRRYENQRTIINDRFRNVQKKKTAKLSFALIL